MTSKKALVWALALAVGALTAAPMAYADSYHEGAHKKGLKEKFFKKTHMILRYEEELDLSEKQVSAIRALMVETKKEFIAKKAEVDILAVDIRSLLREDKVDTKRVHRLIDQKYAAKAAKAKLLVSAYAELKSRLDEDQWDEFRELKKEHYREGSHGR